MSFEQPAFSFNHPNNEPLTPTRSPTSPGYFLSSWETPKQDSRSYDARSPWTPAFDNFRTPGHNNLFTPPRHAMSTTDLLDHPTARKDASISSPRLANDPTCSIPVHALKDAAEPASTSSSFAHHVTNDPDPTVLPSKLAAYQPEASESMNSAGSMQTPPPTSSSASRKKAQEAQLARSSNETIHRGRRMSTPTVPKSHQESGQPAQVEESPDHFSSLNFSPDGISFAMPTGPATAPVYPQHKLFWDPEQGMGMNIDFPVDDSLNGFGLGLQKQPKLLPGDKDNTAGIARPDFFGLDRMDTSGDTLDHTMQSKHSVSVDQMNMSPATAIMGQGSSHETLVGNVVDPSLLFSSPSRAPHLAGQPLQGGTFQPYAHQLRNKEMEREFRNRKSKRKRGIEVDSPAVKAATEALRDAGGDVSTASSDSAVAASFRDHERSLSRHSNRGSRRQRSLSRRRSRAERSLLGSQSKRTSVSLTTDASGRAKIETIMVTTDPKSESDGRMDMDDESSDSDQSSSLSSQGLATSQQTSFAYPMEQNKAKSRRFGVGNHTHSQKSSYASTFASSGASSTVFTNSKGRRPASSSQQQELLPQVRFQSTASFVDEPLGGASSEAETDIEEEREDGDARSELRKVQRQRSNRSQSFTKRPSTLDARPGINKQIQLYGSQNPPHYHKQHPRVTPGSRLAYGQNQQDVTPDLVLGHNLTPSSGNVSNVGAGATRCICNVPDGDGQLMVQCESCEYWLHLACVGLHPHSVPPVYLCPICTKTPNARGTRARDPSKTSSLPVSGSPLAHKSHRSR